MESLTDGDWLALEFEITSLFTGAPIDEEELFAGRSEEVLRILRAVMEKSRHVVLYGERGVGKTSLSNIFWKRFNKDIKSFVVARVQAMPNDGFDTLWSRAIDELRNAAKSMGKPKYGPEPIKAHCISQSGIRTSLSKCNPNARPIIIVDEYDKIKSDYTKECTANLIKELYDFATNVTVILVGVAENVGRLIEDHQSVDRAIVQIPLHRMSNDELREIIQKRASRTRLKFSGEAIWTIITLSRGLPYFTQTLSKHAAFAAISDRRIEVLKGDVEKAMDAFINDAEASFRNSYRTATQSNQDNNFAQSLLACALAETDEEGFFTPNDVVQPFSAIMGETKRIAHFEKHLRRFTSEKGGEILIQRGGERQSRYRFSDPMMQPYVIIRGIQSGIIDRSARERLLQDEQPKLDLSQFLDRQ